MVSIGIWAPLTNNELKRLSNFTNTLFICKQKKVLLLIGVQGNVAYCKSNFPKYYE
jgi:hypothetical protein